MIWLARAVNFLREFLMAQDPPLNLGFINQDVSAQLERSREIIEAAEQLRQVLPLVTDEAAKTKIEEQIKSLIVTAKGLTANATVTSTSAVTLSSSTSKRP